MSCPMNCLGEAGVLRVSQTERTGELAVRQVDVALPRPFDPSMDEKEREGPFAEAELGDPSSEAERERMLRKSVEACWVDDRRKLEELEAKLEEMRRKSIEFRDAERGKEPEQEDPNIVRHLSQSGKHDQFDETPVANDDELLSAMRGLPERTSTRTLPEGEVDQNPELAKRYNWILAIGLPNPVHLNYAKGITWKEAAFYFDKCIRGEEIRVQGASQQHLRFLAEKSIFRRAFLRLPDFAKDKKMYSGHDSFLTLFRHFIITKISLHCGLVTQAWYTEDEKKIVLLVSCTERDLLREADRQELMTELELTVVDPRAVMPVTKANFLLLHWYFKFDVVSQDDPLLDLALTTIEKLRSESSELRSKFSRELAIWEELEDDIHEIKCGNYHASRSSQEHMRSSSKETRHMHVKHENASSNPIIHLGKSEKQSATKEAFAQYLRLRAEYGFSKPSLEIIEEINSKHTRKILLTSFDVIGMFPCNPYRSFEVSLYRGEDADPWIWKEFDAISQNQVDHIKSPFSESDRIKLVKNIIDREVDMQQMLVHRLAASIFPLDTRDKLHVNIGGSWRQSPMKRAWGLSSKGWCRRSIEFFRRMTFYPPLEEIRNYYGERIAMYFAFVSFLGRWMCVPSLIGIVAYILHLAYPNPVEGDERLVFDMLYGVGVCLWGTALLEGWKRRQNVLAFKWGQTKIAHSEAPRPRYQGIQRISPVTNEVETYFPEKFRDYKQFGRMCRQTLSWMLLLMVALLMIVVSVLVGELRTEWIEKKWTGYQYAPQLTSLITSGQMLIFSSLGKLLAHKCNDWENYRTPSHYVNNLIKKIFLFEFINRFNVYFYIGFVKSYTQGCVEYCDEISKPMREKHFICEFSEIPDTSIGNIPRNDNDKMCLGELRLQLRIVFLVMAAANVVEICKPLLKPRFEAWLEKKFDQSIVIPTVAASKDGKVSLSHVAQESMDRSPYGTLEVDGTLEDYLEIMILFGYITLFSLVFPLACVIGTALLLLELRVDGVKLFYVVRRPLPKSAGNIGSWLHIMNILTWLSIFTNAAMIVWTFGALLTRFPDWDGSLIFAILLFTLLFVRVGLQVIIPDVPRSLKVLTLHHEWLTQHIAQKDVDLARDPALSINSLDLEIKSALHGRLRNSEDFGKSKKSVAKRVLRLEKEVIQKQKSVYIRLKKSPNRYTKAAPNEQEDGIIPV